MIWSSLAQLAISDSAWFLAGVIVEFQVLLTISKFKDNCSNTFHCCGVFSEWPFLRLRHRYHLSEAKCKSDLLIETSLEMIHFYGDDNIVVIFIPHVLAPWYGRACRGRAATVSTQSLYHSNNPASLLMGATLPTLPCPFYEWSCC